MIISIGLPYVSWTILFGGRLGSHLNIAFGFEAMARQPLKHLARHSSQLVMPMRVLLVLGEEEWYE